MENELLNMEYNLKPIDSEFLEFTYYYNEVLLNSTLGKYSEDIVDMVFRKQDKYFKKAHKNGKIPQYLKTVEYVHLNNDIIIPPGCYWLSESGRFSCLRMDYYLKGQSFILWDNFRKVLLPMIFTDLNGIDEENSTIFCRTAIPPLDKRGLADPTFINVDWIELSGDPSLQSDEYPKGVKHQLSELELYDVALEFQVSIRNNNDLYSTIMHKYPQDFGLLPCT